MDDMQAHREQVYDLFGLDEFQRIAVEEIMNQLGEIDWPNVTPEKEQLLMSLGSIALEALERHDV